MLDICLLYLSLVVFFLKEILIKCLDFYKKSLPLHRI